MQLHRKVLLGLSVVVVAGSLGWTTTYGLHHRSESFRLEMTGKLSDFFDLPCTIGRIRGHTFTSRLFEDVDIQLPRNRGRVFFCKSAIWQEHEDVEPPFNELALTDGELILGSEEWARNDYQQLLASGLDHDFEDLRLRRVSLDRFVVAFDRGGFGVRCHETSGSIDMSNPQDGVATLTAFELNGVRVSQGVRILAHFRSKKAIDVRQISLDLPSVPLSAMGVVPQVGALSSGLFSGSLQYESRAGIPEISLTGDLSNASLNELTLMVPTGQLSGKLSISIDQSLIVGGKLEELRGRGRIDSLTLGSVAPLINLPTLSGAASLRIESIEVHRDGLKRLSLGGELSGLLIEEWLKPLGRGSATGHLAIRINSVELAGERIRSADVELTLMPSAGETGTFDRDLLLAAAEKALQFSWPSSLPREILPEKVPYVECGVRLLVRDNELRILGTHGPNRDTILTISVFGQPFRIVKEQRGTIDLTAWIEGLWARVRAYSAEDLRDWWQTAGNRSLGN